MALLLIAFAIGYEGKEKGVLAPIRVEHPSSEPS